MHREATKDTADASLPSGSTGFTSPKVGFVQLEDENSRLKSEIRLAQQREVAAESAMKNARNEIDNLNKKLADQSAVVTATETELKVQNWQINTNLHSLGELFSRNFVWSCRLFVQSFKRCRRHIKRQLRYEVS